ncbi:MAG TPA: hypothetical protein VGN57_13750 [Pirellulaceae bacterium]|jgi:hypothetical protein|nr:hypothetical protein [Pirellulaceae bacterium]
MQHGCKDFVSAKTFELMTFFNDKVDVHHVFPQAWCRKRGLDWKVYDSIVNKTPLSKRSNILVSGDAPSIYLNRIEEKHGLTSAQLDDILRTHLIEPSHLRTDDFDGFIAARLDALSELISSALDKPVIKRHGADEMELDLDDEDEDMTAEADDDLATV